ncbi:TPA: carbonic anhydrase [Thermoplasmata archaeon]|nr:carbonic anhydrase [Thermoplasmata archaeon]
MRENLDSKTRLMDGNAMFRRTTDPSLLARLSKAHEPFIAILTCSDARVDPAKVFNLSLGDAFVVRAAGNTATDPSVIGSLEYAVDCLEVKALLVLGHTECGAIKASYECVEPGNLDGVLRDVESAKSKLDPTEARDPGLVAESNVRLQLRKLEDTSTIIRDAVARGKLTMYGAVLDIGTGAVRFI